jgi:hypothetical protein
MFCLETNVLLYFTIFLDSYSGPPGGTGGQQGYATQG